MPLSLGQTKCMIMSDDFEVSLNFKLHFRHKKNITVSLAMDTQLHIVALAMDTRAVFFLRQ